MSDTRPICDTCGQYMPLATPEIAKLDAATEFKAALGRRDPVSHGEADRLSPSQRGAIRSIASAKGLNASKECRQIVGCEPEALTMFAASKFISFLIRVGTERQAEGS